MAETGGDTKGLPPTVDNNDEGWNQVVNVKAQKGQARLEKAKDDKAKKKGIFKLNHGLKIWFN